MQLEEVDCNICGSHNYRIIFKSKDFRLRTSTVFFNLVKCNNCGFVYLNPRPHEKEIYKFYPTDFNRKDNSFFFKIIEPCFNVSQKRIIRELKKYKLVGKTLDIGCGNGQFVSLLLEEGYDAMGIEKNPDAEKFSDPDVKGIIFYRELADCRFKDSTFDIITMFHSLEHVSSPGPLLEEIEKLLKDDGVLYISVPNIHFWEFFLFGPYHYNLEVPRHLYFFNKKTLKKFLLRYGFTPKKFLYDCIFDRVSTPASLYHSLCNYLEDKGIDLSSIVKLLIYIPLVLIRLILNFIFFFQSQNLQVVCVKSTYENKHLL